VSVTPSSALTGLGTTVARRIDVTVAHAPNVSVTLSGYRTAF